MPKLLRDRLRLFLEDTDLTEHIGGDVADVLARLFRVFRTREPDMDFASFTSALEALGYSVAPVAYALKRTPKQFR